jgi:hypothetical protein
LLYFILFKVFPFFILLELQLYFCSFGLKYPEIEVLFIFFIKIIFAQLLYELLHRSEQIKLPLYRPSKLIFQLQSIKLADRQLKLIVNILKPNNKIKLIFIVLVGVEVEIDVVTQRPVLERGIYV